MKKFGKLSTKAKCIIMIGCVIILGSLLLIKPLQVTTFSSTSKIARLQCQDAGDILSLKINSSADIIRNYSYLIANLAETDLIPRENKREFMLKEMILRYENEKALNNLWCTFEPNALDGMDAHFINRPGSDERGVFNPWIVGGRLIPTKLDDYTGI